MTADKYIGPVRILDGQPVPYSGTVQRQRADNGEWESVRAAGHLSEILDHMKQTRGLTAKDIKRTEGSYFFW